MALLNSVNYDPTGAAAQTRATATALAMTVVDATNIALPFLVPPNGNVLVRIQCAVHGGTATPFIPGILLGVMQGTTVVARQAATPSGPALAAGLSTAQSLFVVRGLTAGASLTWAAAYGVDVAATGSAIKFGGPNDASATTGFGAFVFELWTV